MIDNLRVYVTPAELRDLLSILREAGVRTCDLDNQGNLSRVEFAPMKQASTSQDSSPEMDALRRIARIG